MPTVHHFHRMVWPPAAPASFLFRVHAHDTPPHARIANTQTPTRQNLGLRSPLHIRANTEAVARAHGDNDEIADGPGPASLTRRPDLGVTGLSRSSQISGS